MPRALTIAALPTPRFHYAQAVQAGQHYYLSGLLGISDEGELAAGGPGAETASILARLPALLAELGLGWQNLVFVRLYCTDMGRFDEVNLAWEKVFTPDRAPPARTSVGVAALPLGASVEIELVLHKAD